MKKIAVIGAGISGLSVAQALKSDFDVTVYEAQERPGGLIKCDFIDGRTFHLTGGHVFNTKIEEARAFFSKFVNANNLTKAVRNAAIAMPDGKTVGYPIENHLYQLDREVVRKVLNDLTASREKSPKDAENFEEFLKLNFGPTLYEIYFKPYNRKIWKCDLSSIPMEWLDGKFPMPTPAEIILDNIFRKDEADFVHSSFYYPKKGGSQHIVEAFSQGLNIICNSPADCIELTGGSARVNGRAYDAVVATGNIRQLLPGISGINIDDALRDGISRLSAHGTTSVFCEIDRNPYSWIYQPSEAHQSHRIICTGNFAASNNGASQRLTATIEFTGYLPKEEIDDNLTRIPFKPQYITHHFEPFTYPIQTAQTRRLISRLRDVLEAGNIYLTGRFAEWEYYNMDTAMGAALRTAQKIRHALKS